MPDEEPVLKLIHVQFWHLPVINRTTTIPEKVSAVVEVNCKVQSISICANMKKWQIHLKTLYFLLHHLVNKLSIP